MTDDLVTRLRMVTGFVRFETGDRVAAAACLSEEAAARITADAATIARLEGERERLALAICGGEDAPGYANAQTVEALEKVARDNAAAAMWQIDRTMKAEAKVAALVEALEEIASYDTGATAGLAYTARAAIAAAKGGA